MSKSDFLSIVRHSLIIGGLIAVSAGVATTGLVTELSGSIISLAGVVWQAWTDGHRKGVSAGLAQRNEEIRTEEKK